MKKNEKILIWLYNPFKYIAGIKSLIVGISTMLIIGFFSHSFNIRIDGLHHLTLLSTNNFFINALDLIIHWMIISIIFCILLLVSQTKYRIIDIFGTLSITFIPIFFSVLLVNYFDQNLILMGFLGLFLVIWQVILIYNAIKTSAGISGIKLNGIVIVGFITATLISYKTFPIYYIKQNNITQFSKNTEISNLVIDEDSIEQLSIELVKSFKMHNYNSIIEHFNPKMKRIFTEDRLEIIWRTVVQRHGVLIKILNIETKDSEDLKSTFLNCQFAHDKLIIQFTYDKNDQITGFYFR